MSKKTVGLWIGVSVFLCILLTGCGAMQQVRNVAETASKETKTEGTAEEKEASGTDLQQEDTETEEVPVLGMEEIGDYDGFQYLQKEVLTGYMEEDRQNGRIRRKTLTIYVPNWKDSWVVLNGDEPGSAGAYVFGVDYYFSINPYLISGQDGDSPEELLRGYLDEIYYEGERPLEEECWDLEISDIRPEGENAVAATAKYCSYDYAEEEYHAYYETHYLKILEPEVVVLLEVRIDSEDVDSRTPELLEELEAFYEVELEWDGEEAQEKLRRFLEETEGGIDFSGFLKYDFPEGWEVEYTDGEMAVYAPGGDSDGAGCGIAAAKLSAVAIGGELTGWENDEEYLEMIIDSLLGEDAEDVTIRACGETFIGETVAAEFQMNDNGDMADCVFYLGRTDKELYVVVAIQYQWLEADAVGVDVFEVAEDLLQNGRIIDK